MIITAIMPKKRVKGQFEIYCDGTLFGVVSLDAIYLKNLREGADVAEEILAEAVGESEFLFAKEYAFGRVACGAVTKKQLRDKLASKGFKGEVATRALALVQEYGYLDDAKFAEDYVACHKGRDGKMKIKASLLQKGIEKSIIDTALNYDEAEDDGINQFARKFREKYPLSDMKNKQKLIRQLQYRGYSWATISSCLQNLGENNDDIQDF